MPIDPRIAMSFQAPQIASPMDLAQNAFALKGAMQQNALAEAKMAEMQRQQQSQNALRQLFAGGKMPDAAAVYAIDPELGGLFAKNQAEIDRANAAAAASEAERAGSQYKNESAKFGDLLNLLTASVDEPSYQANLKLAGMRGFDTKFAPPTFDAGWVANAQQAVLTAKERAELEDKAAGRKISQGQLDVSRGQLGVSQGNLKVAQDRLAFDREKGKTDLPPAEAARQRVLGETQAKFQVALPQAVQDANQAIGLIDEMIGNAKYDPKSKKIVYGDVEPHPGFAGAVGFGIGQRYVPGTDAASFQALFDQVQGGAFLQAFETLRGGGAITEKEGAKATAAKNRMSLAQSEDEFVKAALEFKEVLRRGIENAQTKANLGGATPAAAGPRRTKSGVTYTVEEE